LNAKSDFSTAVITPVTFSVLLVARVLHRLARVFLKPRNFANAFLSASEKLDPPAASSASRPPGQGSASRDVSESQVIPDSVNHYFYARFIFSARPVDHFVLSTTH